MSASKSKTDLKEKMYLKYYNKLIDELLWADLHLKLWKRLMDYIKDYPDELNAANTFFGATARAHWDAALVHLFKVIDTHHDSLNIWKFLNFADSNLEIFSTQAFSERQKGNPNFHYQVKYHIPVAHQNVEGDRAKLMSKAKAMEALNKRRDKLYSHIDRAFALGNTKISKENLLTFSDVENLITTLFEVLSRYSNAYNSSTYARKWIGEDDIQVIMDSLRFKFEEERKQVEIYLKQDKT